MEVECLIVGAGPAGSMAAREMAARGIDTLVLEKRQEIGVPKRCAEGVSCHGLEKLGIKINDLGMSRTIKGAVLYSPSGKSVAMEGNDMEGYVLERKVFEKYLASEAIKEGARYMIKAQAMKMEREGGLWKVHVRSLDGDDEIKAKLVIGADGVESKVGRWAGLKTLNRLTDYHSGIQFEMAGVNANEEYIHLFFGNNIAPLGYAWIFPKAFSANVGLGILEKGAKMRAYDYLKKFIDEHDEIFRNASPIEVNSGGVPVDHFTGMVSEGVMLVGDAAQLVNPIHGGGIVRAMHSSLMAAEVADKAFKEKNLSKGRLMEYENRWNEEYEEKTNKLLKLRSFLEKLEDKDFELLADILEGEDIFKLTQAKLSFFVKKLIKRPSLFGLARKYLKE
ncbi:MAG: NAD(P)/FAD-dependent oxidoreductase [Candidatus Thermoplasmatota archaeon]|nr:NAD(P)/FAD-dependent oxidoreductase [Candidatus Thermoplasmatota archaeon]